MHKFSTESIIFFETYFSRFSGMLHSFGIASRIPLVLDHFSSEHNSQFWSTRVQRRFFIHGTCPSSGANSEMVFFLDINSFNWCSNMSFACQLRKLNDLRHRKASWLKNQWSVLTARPFTQWCLGCWHQSSCNLSATPMENWLEFWQNISFCDCFFKWQWS